MVFCAYPHHTVSAHDVCELCYVTTPGTDQTSCTVAWSNSDELPSGASTLLASYRHNRTITRVVVFVISFSRTERYSHSGSDCDCQLRRHHYRQRDALVYHRLQAVLSIAKWCGTIYLYLLSAEIWIRS